MLGNWVREPSLGEYRGFPIVHPVFVLDEQVMIALQTLTFT